MHFRGIPFKESPAATNEERIPGEHSTGLAVGKKVADAILSVAGSVQRGNLDPLANSEIGVVGWRGGDFGTVLAAYHRDWISLELVPVSSGHFETMRCCLQSAHCRRHDPSG